MAVSFFSYCVYRVFKDASQLFYSFLITILFLSLCKAVLLFCKSKWLLSEKATSLFQLSLFLFIPVYLFLELNKKKWKRKKTGYRRFKEISDVYCWIVVVVVCLVLLRLLFFIFMPPGLATAAKHTG